MTTTKRQIEDQARQILLDHGLFAIPIDPVVLANRLGIKVHNAKFSDDNLSAMLSRKGDAITILVEQSEAPFRKRFSIAHELAHHFLHLSVDGEITDTSTDLFRTTDGSAHDFSPQRRKEVEANQFAAALLMPEELMMREWQNNKSLAKMARLFNVSEEAMGIRIDSLGLV